MAKARKRRKAAGRSSAGNVAVQERTARTVSTSVAQRPSLFTTGGSRQNVLFSTMIALGFWGFAIFCTFFYTEDANHYLYGAIMALTAVGWSVLVARRWLSYRR
jgi:hypothetical protein